MNKLVKRGSSILAVRTTQDEIGFVRIWRFTAASGREQAFEYTYGPDGEWARLFALSEEYRGTRLHHLGGGDYLVIDRWATRESWQRFSQDFGVQYEALDGACASLT